MNHASVFTGIGGFDLAAEWAGMNNVFQVEIDERCQKVLNKRFPNVQRFRNIKEFSGIPFSNAVDVLSGGDPCQPHSVAGLGKGAADDRYLWPEMYRIGIELQCPWIINENVGGSIANGILDIKIADLEDAGYSCQPYSIPAEAVGALHQRERIWLVAYNSYFHRDRQVARALQKAEARPGGVEAQRNEIHQLRELPDIRPASLFGFGDHPKGDISRAAIESGIMGMLHGLSEGMDYADRGQRIKETGNAIVPQIAYEFFRGIKALNEELSTHKK